jgi:hypothetical protein
VTGDEYKRRVRALHCAACGCAPPCEANHVTFGRGVGQRSSDFDTFPLCLLCHREFTDHSGRFRGWSKARRRLWQGDMACAAGNLITATKEQVR